MSQQSPPETWMHNSQCGACRASLVISGDNLKPCPPPDCLLAAAHCRQPGQCGIHTMSSAGQEHHIVYPWGSVGIISPGRRDRCVYRDTVCSPARPEGPAVPVNTAELWGPRTCWGQVQVRWDVFVRVGVGGVCMCSHSCVCVCVWVCFSKAEGLWRWNTMIISTWQAS